MDVRCEKCQTEYELDEARLKPGGVTVKCTNCGHMFKIRKRTVTSTGAASVERPRTTGSHQTVRNRADSVLDDSRGDFEGPTTVDRQWLIRLENGEQKSCRELATLQQWIVACVVSRESLISRTGKTWKRLGDIAELAQYFDIADEARTTRGERNTRPTGRPASVPAGTIDPRGTMMGTGVVASAAGGTILPDDDEDDVKRTTGNFRAARPATQPPPVPRSASNPGIKTPPLGSNANASLVSTRRPVTTPPPPPARKPPTNPPPAGGFGAMPQPPGNRQTAGWATDGQGPTSDSQSRPFVGKLSAISDEPAFAGRVRASPGDEAVFETGKVRMLDDDDDLLPGRRGSRAGLWIVLGLLLAGAAGAAVYFLAIDKDEAAPIASTSSDAGVAAVSDAAMTVTPMTDAVAAAPTPTEVARAELGQDNEERLRGQLDKLPADDAIALAVRANVAAAIAQALNDRAGLVDKSTADKLRKEAKTIAIAAATEAQKAHKAAPEDPAANLAMAHVLRLQGKSLKEIGRHLDTAKANIGDWVRDAKLAEALALRRDGKLDDAKQVLTAIDQGDHKLEISGDVRARFQLALIALAQGRTADAKLLVGQVLAAQPDHAGTKALEAKLETAVATTDPLPEEDASSAKPNPGSGKPTPPEPGPATESYEKLVSRANQLAESNCSKASEVFLKALEQRPNGPEALTGLGYCHIDAKQFASAHGRFRAALAVATNFEGALYGIAEAYQQQGRKDDAIEAYKTYLLVYPSSAKAKRQLERLGGTASEPTPPSGGSGSAAPPTTPTPTDGAGAGSG
ncbi:MAG: zinc-ribbon domain-containing protein [Kofleriaceae bacterium]